MKVYVKFLSQIAQETVEKKLKKLKFSFSSILFFLFLMSQTRYNISTYNVNTMFWYSFDRSTSMTHRFSLLLYSILSISRWSSDHILCNRPHIILCACPNIDNTPLISNEIERQRERLQLSTELLVSDFRVLMERLVDRR